MRKNLINYGFKNDLIVFRDRIYNLKGGEKSSKKCKI